MPWPAETVTTQPEKRELVILGASAPQTVRARDKFTARFVAYSKALEAEVREELSRLSPRATSQLGLQACHWQPGTRVTIRLVAGTLGVKPAEQVFVWEGSRNRVDFAVSVPDDAHEGSELLEFSALIDGIVVATLLLDLEIAGWEANINEFGDSLVHSVKILMRRSSTRARLIATQRSMLQSASHVTP